jgi:hypothetical protein
VSWNLKQLRVVPFLRKLHVFNSNLEELIGLNVALRYYLILMCDSTSLSNKPCWVLSHMICLFYQHFSNYVCVIYSGVSQSFFFLSYYYYMLLISIKSSLFTSYDKSFYSMGKTFGCSIIPAVVYPYCEVLFLSKETENNIFFVCAS